MTPEAQRMAIAEACGWNRLGIRSDITGWRCPRGTPPGFGNGFVTCPDYLNDLNSMHEAEKVLTDDQFDERYVVELGKLLYPKGHGPWKWSECPACVVKTTAAQRAEAFLRTIGRWQDDAEDGGEYRRGGK